MVVTNLQQSIEGLRSKGDRMSPDSLRKVIEVATTVASFAMEHEKDGLFRRQMEYLFDRLGGVEAMVADLYSLTQELYEKGQFADAETELNTALSYAVRGDSDSFFLGPGNDDNSKVRLLRLAEGAATRAVARLRREEIRLRGAWAFQTAASLHLHILMQLAKLDLPVQSELRFLSAEYADYQTETIGRIKRRIESRITFELRPIPPGQSLIGDSHFWAYCIDGTERFRALSTIGEIYVYRLDHIKALASPVIAPFRIAVEAWRAVHEARGRRLGPILLGLLIQAAERPIGYVYNGMRIGIERLEVATRLTSIVIHVSPDLYDEVASGPSLNVGQEVVGSIELPNEPACFVLGGRRWGVDCGELITLNSSDIKWVESQHYRSLEHEGDFHCRPLRYFTGADSKSPAPPFPSIDPSHSDRIRFVRGYPNTVRTWKS